MGKSHEKLSLSIFQIWYSNRNYFDWRTFHVGIGINFRLLLVASQQRLNFKSAVRIVTNPSRKLSSIQHLALQFTFEAQPTRTSHGDCINIYKICKHSVRWERCDNGLFWIHCLCGFTVRLAKLNSTRLNPNWILINLNCRQSFIHLVAYRSQTYWLRFKVQTCWVFFSPFCLGASLIAELSQKLVRFHLNVVLIAEIPFACVTHFITFCGFKIVS